MLVPSPNYVENDDDDDTYSSFLFDLLFYFKVCHAIDQMMMIQVLPTSSCVFLNDGFLPNTQFYCSENII